MIISEIEVRIYDMIYFQLRSNDMYTKQRNFGTLQLADGGRMRIRHGWRHKQRFLECYQLIFVARGSLFIEAANTKFVVGENELLLLPPYQMMRGYQSSMEEVDFYWADFSTNHADNLRMPPLLQLVAVADSHEMHMLFKLMLEARDDAGAAHSELNEAAILMILSAVDKQRTQLAENNLIRRIREYIESHLSEPLTAQSVAVAVSYHKDYVNRLIKSATGSTLKQYINQRKMVTARLLLRTSTYSIGEISDLLGYSDSNLFTKFFLYHQKVSPMDYRRGSG